MRTGVESLKLRISKRTPSLVQAERLARALGATLSEMLAEVERGSNETRP
jgi:hypothetical protein